MNDKIGKCNGGGGGKGLEVLLEGERLDKHL